MKKKWEVNINGVNHEIQYSGNKVIVNGQKYKVKSQNWFIRLIDYPIRIDDAELRVVAIGNKVDLSVNGIYYGSGEEYQPLSKVPTMCNVMVGISCLGGILCCGIYGLFFGALFSGSYIKKGLQGKTSGVILSFICCTVLQLLYVILAVLISL